MTKISASIVVYNEDEETLKRVVENFMSIKLEKKLVIVDNSPSNDIRALCKNYDDVKYICSGKNIGFGAGHNLAFKNLSQKSDIHLIINPDTYFSGDDIRDMIVWMSEKPEISLAVPRVYYPDGTIQHTIRNIPTPMTLIKRRLNIRGIFDDFVKKDEFQDVEFNQVTKIPFAHGCFFAFKTDVFNKLNGFDEDFFMYMEDVDIFVRAKRFGRTVINPYFRIYHEHRKGSSKCFKLLFWHISSAIHFFLEI